jgi:cell wall-associated NlpC family hydrolase
MPPMRNQPSPPKHSWHAAAAACVGAALLACAPPSLAQDAPVSLLDGRAATVVRDAAATALLSARNLTSSALDLIGIRYKWGGATPASGLDCSGLVQFVFQQVTGVTLPRSTKELSRIGERVTLADLQPGDLVFFNTLKRSFSHVGIYIGANRFVHAPRTGGSIRTDDMSFAYWAKRYNGARRPTTAAAPAQTIYPAAAQALTTTGGE